MMKVSIGYVVSMMFERIAVGLLHAVEPNQMACL